MKVAMKLGFAFNAAAVLLLTVTSAVAQPGPLPPSDQEAPTALQTEIRADVAEIRANAKVSELTRQQIQQLRSALKAKLSALRH
jgi:hypothetical protein